MDKALLERQPSVRDPLPFTIQGASRAAEYTGFWVPEWSLLLDCGLPTRAQPRAVLCTHTHVDHVAFFGAQLHESCIIFQRILPRGVGRSVAVALDRNGAA